MRISRHLSLLSILGFTGVIACAPAQEPGLPSSQQAIIGLEASDWAKVGALSQDGLIAIRNPGQILGNLPARQAELKERRAKNLCQNTGLVIDYDTSLEVRRLFKDPDELRKSVFAAEITHRLIVSSSEYFAYEFAPAGRYAVRILTSYAEADYPELSQRRQYGHTLTTAS
ncbi:MAG: hypothetical protein AAF674_03845 [Pseudomonadota bacterium]